MFRKKSKQEKEAPEDPQDDAPDDGQEEERDEVRDGWRRVKEARQRAQIALGQQEVLTKQDYANWRGISLQAEARERRSGKGPPFEVTTNGEILYRMKEVSAWKEEQVKEFSWRRACAEWSGHERQKHAELDRLEDWDEDSPEEVPVPRNIRQESPTDRVPKEPFF